MTATEEDAMTVQLNPYLSFRDDEGMCVDRFGTSWMVNLATESK